MTIEVNNEIGELIYQLMNASTAVVAVAKCIDMTKLTAEEIMELIDMYKNELVILQKININHLGKA